MPQHVLLATEQEGVGEVLVVRRGQLASHRLKKSFHLLAVLLLHNFLVVEHHEAAVRFLGKDVHSN